MKKSLVFMLFTAVCLAGFAQKKTFSIKGEVPADVKGKVYMRMYNPDESITTDSTTIEGRYFSFHRSIEETLPIMLIYENDDRKGLNMFVEAGDKVKIKFANNNFSAGEISGSSIDILFTKAKEEASDTNTFMEEYAEVHPELRGVAVYAMRHPESIFSPYFVAMYLAPFLDYDVLKPMVDTFVAVNQKGFFFSVLEKRVESLALVQVGKQTPDFSLADTSGQMQNLYEFLKKNEYTLLDFWASWCSPCRKENPNIVAAYNEFSGKGFGIFAVSLDNNMARWTQAIAADGLIWTHVSDLKGWGNEAAKLYSIRAIPANLLVDKNGKIVARNLYEEALVEKLKELLN